MVDGGFYWHGYILALVLNSLPCPGFYLLRTGKLWCGECLSKSAGELSNGDRPPLLDHRLLSESPLTAGKCRPANVLSQVGRVTPQPICSSAWCRCVYSICLTSVPFVLYPDLGFPCLAQIRRCRLLCISFLLA